VHLTAFSNPGHDLTSCQILTVSPFGWGSAVAGGLQRFYHQNKIITAQFSDDQCDKNQKEKIKLLFKYGILQLKGI